jgi:hypothetical protein
MSSIRMKIPLIKIKIKTKNKTKLKKQKKRSGFFVLKKKLIFFGFNL